MDAQDKLDANLTASSSGVPTSSTEILERAAEILAERGVHRGALVNPKTGREVCAIGALQLAAGREVVSMGHEFGMSPFVPLTTALWEAAGRLDEEIGGSIESFNDDPATSDEDIVLAMKRAAHG